jgi:hypothetical protein
MRNLIQSDLRQYVDNLVANEVKALADELYCNDRERDILRKTIEGIVKGVRIATRGAAHLAFTGQCPDYNRTHTRNPDGSISYNETMCDHGVNRGDCVMRALDP